MDKTLYPPRVLAFNESARKTLQGLSLWPSAELLVQPKGLEVAVQPVSA